jgi:hypothetical protein
MSTQSMAPVPLAAPSAAKAQKWQSAECPILGKFDELVNEVIDEAEVPIISRSQRRVRPRSASHSV